MNLANHFATQGWLTAACGAGFLISVLKQWIVAQQAGATIDGKFIASYFGKHWLDTVVALIGAAVLYVIAASTDQLNVMAALTAGYTGNSVADMLTAKAGGRAMLIAGKGP